MEPTQEFIDELFRERVLKARRASMTERFRAGAQLFEGVCKRMRAGIRMQFPTANDDEVTRILRKRLAIARAIENSPCPVTKP